MTDAWWFPAAWAGGWLVVIIVLAFTWLTFASRAYDRRKAERDRRLVELREQKSRTWDGSFRE